MKINGQMQTNTVKLVPELLKKTGMTQEQKENRKLMSEIAKFTIMNPR